MKNNYLILSEDKVSIDNHIRSIIEDNKLKDVEIIKYDYPDTTIYDVLEVLNTYNFLSNCKVVIYNSCSFLSKEKPIKRQDGEEQNKGQRLNGELIKRQH